MTDERITSPALGSCSRKLSEALLGNDCRKIESDADALVKAAGFPPMDHDSADFGRLCRRLLRARIEYTQIETDRWNGDYQDDHLNRSTRVGHHQSHGPEGIKTTPSSSPLVSVVLEKYLAASQRPARTAKPLKAEFLKFIETIGGDRAIASITKADGVAYKESLQQVRKVSVTTCIKHISNVDAFFKWAEVRAYITDGATVMKGLAPSKRQAKKTALKRRPFTDGELLTVFGSQEFRRQREERSERFWMVMLLLFECCRREEAAQLYLKDIGEVLNNAF